MSEPVDGRVTVTLVLPVLDEEPGIGPFLDELRRAASAFRSTRIAEIVVVDDGSTDGTRTTLEGAGTSPVCPRSASCTGRGPTAPSPRRSRGPGRPAPI